MKELSEEELLVLKTAAEAMMTDDEICLICEIDPDEFRQLMLFKEGQIYETIAKARLERKMAVNKSIIDCAVQGSSPAQAMALKLMTDEQLKRM